MSVHVIKHPNKMSSCQTLPVVHVNCERISADARWLVPLCEPCISALCITACLFYSFDSCAYRSYNHRMAYPEFHSQAWSVWWNYLKSSQKCNEELEFWLVMPSLQSNICLPNATELNDSILSKACIHNNHRRSKIPTPPPLKNRHDNEDLMSELLNTKSTVKAETTKRKGVQKENMSIL